MGTDDEPKPALPLPTIAEWAASLTSDKLLNAEAKLRDLAGYRGTASFPYALNNEDCEAIALELNRLRRELANRDADCEPECEPGDTGGRGAYQRGTGGRGGGVKAQAGTGLSGKHGET